MVRTMLPKVKMMAAKLEYLGGRHSLQADDLSQAAVIGLLEARKRFDPSKASWPTFALLRAHGAMQDELREMDHVPRLERARAKKDGRALLGLETASHKPEVFDGRDRRTPLPADGAAARELWRRLRAVLGRRSSEVMERYYRWDYTLKEIGEQLGLSESRVCQLHANAVRLLRRKGRHSIA